MFDTKWFDELREITCAEISKVQPPEGAYVPELNQFSHILSWNFIEQITKLTYRLNRLKYRFSPMFKVYEQHICTFPKGKAFRKQINIGFSAGESSDDDFMRIGIGFRISTNLNPKGWEEYADFYMKSQTDKTIFDSVFMQLGNYSEPDMAINNSMSDGFKNNMITKTSAEYEDTWCFFGKRLGYNEDANRAILHSLDTLVAEIDKVFKLLSTSGLIYIENL